MTAIEGGELRLIISDRDKGSWNRVMENTIHEAIILRAEGCDPDNPVQCYRERQSRTPEFEPIYGGV